MCINSLCLGHGLRDLGIFYFQRASKSGRLTLHHSLSLLENISLYVKFMLMISSLDLPTKTCKEFGDMMSREFEMSIIGELIFFVRFQIKQIKEGTFLYQSKYLKYMSKKFGMEDAKPIKIHMATNGHLDLDGGKSVDQKLYRSVIGSLFYMTASRPDVLFSVCMCARFQAAPKECHMTAVKRILRYLKFTPNICLWYPKGAQFELIGFSDSDYAGCKVNIKKHFGHLSIAWKISYFLFFKKTKFSCPLYRGSRIYFSRKLLCAAIVDEANFIGLWYSLE